MGLHQLAGHQGARRRLSESLASFRLPQVILVTGPEGVGKQRLALWLAQLLLCPSRGADGPCGSCRPCRKVLDLSHPDVHWFVPIPRPKSGDPAKQVEEAGDLLAEAVAARRERPLYEPADGMSFHPLASARLLLRRAAMTPVEGGRKVFVVGQAERLVTQESSPEAANALLKLLEEPPADTWIVLTTPEPERVLPTIRSRAVPLRLARLPDAEVRAFAESVIKPPAADLPGMVRRAEGLIGRLAGSNEGAEKAVVEARSLLDSLKSGGRFERSLRQPPWAARGAFTDLLDALAEELATRARAASADGTTGRFVAALDRVHAARVEAQGNVNPQLLLAALTGELAEVL